MNVIAADVAATYGARVIAAGESEFVTLDIPASRESLLRNDPRVARLERIGVASTASASLVPRTDAYATPWTLGNYTYDGGGNITAVGTTSFSYDGASRVLSGDSGDGHSQSYTYDGFGTILTITTDGGLESVGVNWATNQASVTSANIFGTYDTAGRVETYLNSDHFTYDGLDSIKESTLANVRRAYLYTASDERIAVIGLDQYGTEGSSEWTIRTPSHEVLRRFTKSAGLWKWKEDYVYAGSRLLAADTDTSASRTFFHLDHLGTPRLITGNGGNKIALHNYFAFGEESSSVLQDAEARKFTGHERDAVNLDYMHARYYNATWGRFLSVDPVLDTERTTAEPQMWNRYAYVRKNPVTNVDPNGKETRVFFVGATNIVRDSSGAFGHTAIYVSAGGHSNGLSFGGQFDFRRDSAYQNLVDSYTSEGRTVDVLVLNTTPAQDKAMLAHIDSTTANMGSWSLLSNNCTTTTAETLKPVVLPSTQTVVWRGGVIKVDTATDVRPEQLKDTLLSTKGVVKKHYAVAPVEPVRRDKEEYPQQ